MSAFAYAPLKLEIDNDMLILVISNYSVTNNIISIIKT